jgi:hypothetical protein
MLRNYHTRTETTNGDVAAVPKISRILSGLAVIAATSLFMLAPSASGATVFPDHQVPQPVCQGGFGAEFAGVPNQIYANYPLIFKPWNGGSEKVAYSVDLQVWNGASFVAYDTTKPYVWGIADYTGSIVSAYRIGAKYDSSDPSAGARFVFNALPSGYYRLMEYFYWFSTGQQQVVWSNWCQV